MSTFIHQGKQSVTPSYNYKQACDCNVSFCVSSLEDCTVEKNTLLQIWFCISTLPLMWKYLGHNLKANANISVLLNMRVNGNWCWHATLMNK